MNLLMIPIHIPKVNWAISLIGDLNACGGLPDDVTLVLILSNELELTKFSELLVSLGLEEKIVLLDAEAYSRSAFPSGSVTEALATNANKGVVNVKKFLGLHWALAKSYDYAVVIDVDVYFSPKANIKSFFEISRADYEKGTIIGSSISASPESIAVAPQVNSSALALFSDDDAKELLQKEVNDVYTWFLQPPSYLMNDVRSFFEYMEGAHGSVEEFFLKLNWLSFDQIVFSYFRVIHSGAKIISYNSSGVNSCPEHLSVTELDMIRMKMEFEPAWLSFFSFLLSGSATRVRFPSVGIFFHFDRIGR